MDFLTGKFLKSTKTFSLTNCLVDGEVKSVSSFDVPIIYNGELLKVVSATDDSVVLRNVLHDDFYECELSMDMIEDFKVVSKAELERIL